MPDLPSKHGFSPAYRLRSKADFAAMRRAKRIHQGAIQIVHKPNTLGHGRIGFAISRKYGNSVERHQLKRHLREAFRCHGLRNIAVDALVIPRGTHHEQANVRADIQQCFDRILKVHAT